MPGQKPFSRRQVSLLCLAYFILLAPVLAQKPPSESSPEERNKRMRAEMKQAFTATVGLEVVSARVSTIEPIYQGRAVYFSFPRNSLTIINPELAKDFSLIEMQAETEADTVKVRIAIIYNQLSEPEWWKNKKETEVGTYTIAFGETLRPAELLQFGIEPFDLKALSRKPVLLKREEYPRIINPSIALDVTEVEKSLAGYRFSFKNVSAKDIAALEIYCGGRGFGGGGLGHNGRQAFLSAGQTYEDINPFSAADVEKYGLTIKLILYTDGTYEGDLKAATQNLAREAGYNIQAAKLLPRLEEAMKVPDDELSQYLLKMEADLWQMPEAMDKASSIELLKIKYPAFDEQTIAELYEEFKSGFYNARNTLLVDLGQIKGRVEKPFGQESAADQVKLFRHILTRLKERIEKAASLNH